MPERTRTALLGGVVGFASALVMTAAVPAVLGGDGSNGADGRMARSAPVRTATEARVASVFIDGSLPPEPEGPRCRELEEELWRRHDAGEIVEEPYVELTDEEYEAAPLDLPAPETRMAAPGERPSFEHFGVPYDVADISNDHLDDVVGRCWEAGLID